MKLTQAQEQEIDGVRQNIMPTRRPVVPAIEEILHIPLPVLDHGFVRAIDYMGNDTAIVQAARVSYGIGTKKISEDRGLINYLMRHHHTTPFEMCELKLHVKLPIFVARQWIRHRTANVNEYSARYSILDKEFYIPEPEQLATQSKKNRQGREEILKSDEAQWVLNMLKYDAENAYGHYTEMLNEDEKGQPLDPKRDGLARELARMDLTLNFYTQWYWKIDLHNLFHFLLLRADNHAQYEIRVYAQLILEQIVKSWVPFAHDAFLNYQLHAVHVSATAVKVLQRLIAGEKVTQETSGLPKGEWKEFVENLGLQI